LHQDEPFSVGEPNVSDESDDERLMTEDTDNMDGYGSKSASSDGKQVSTMASKQFTNSSALSAVQLDC
jgi:hypothetical protein